MIKTMPQIEQAFEEKVKMIESAQSRDMDFLTYFVMQVGPRDAPKIVNQMKAFFISGYAEASKDILGA